MDALDRMADRRIDEHQEAIDHVARDAERLDRHHDRLAMVIAHDAAGLLTRNTQGFRELLDEILAMIAQRRCFQALADARVAQDHDLPCRHRRGDVEVEQDETPLVFGGGEENIVEFAGDRRIHGAAQVRDRLVFDRLFFRRRFDRRGVFYGAEQSPLAAQARLVERAAEAKHGRAAGRQFPANR